MSTQTHKATCEECERTMCSDIRFICNTLEEALRAAVDAREEGNYLARTARLQLARDRANVATSSINRVLANTITVGRKVSFSGKKIAPSGGLLYAHPDGPDTFTAIVAGTTPDGMFHLKWWVSEQAVGVAFKPEDLKIED